MDRSLLSYGNPNFLVSDGLSDDSFSILAVYMAYALGPGYKRLCRLLYGRISLRMLLPQPFQMSLHETYRNLIWRAIRWFPRGLDEDKPALRKRYYMSQLMCIATAEEKENVLYEYETSARCPRIEAKGVVWERLRPRRGDILVLRFHGHKLIYGDHGAEELHYIRASGLHVHNVRLGPAYMPDFLRDCRAARRSSGRFCYDMWYYGNDVEWFPCPEGRSTGGTTAWFPQDLGDAQSGMRKTSQYYISPRQKEVTLRAPRFHTNIVHPWRLFQLVKMDWSNTTWEQVIGVPEDSDEEESGGEEEDGDEE